MFSAISRTNAVLHCAACSKLRGGTKRVLVRPGTDALAIAAILQAGTLALPRSTTALRITTPIPRDTPAVFGWCSGIHNNDLRRMAAYASRPEWRRRSAHTFVSASLHDHFYCLGASRGRRAAQNRPRHQIL